MTLLRSLRTGGELLTFVRAKGKRWYSRYGAGRLHTLSTPQSSTSKSTSRSDWTDDHEQPKVITALALSSEDLGKGKAFWERASDLFFDHNKGREDNMEMNNVGLSQEEAIYQRRRVLIGIRTRERGNYWQGWGPVRIFLRTRA